MREIKFRGRRKNSSEWVYGAFLAIPKLCSYIYDVQPDGQATRYLVDEDTVGMYTGHSDVMGTDMYEGDIIKTREGDVGVIVWEPELGGFRARLTDDSFYTLTAFFASMFSVIGNVHDNPELLS